MLNRSFWKDLRENGEAKIGRYGTFLSRFSISHWRFDISLCKFEENWSLHLFCLWIQLWKTKVEPKEMMDKWGFCVSFEERYAMFDWGWEHPWFYYFPWSFNHARWYQGRRDGGFDLVGHCFYESEAMPPQYYREVFDFTYTLKSGEVQKRQATVDVHRITWCWRGWPFRLLYWPNKMSTGIYVNFNDEVGERSGTWKGGVMGCGHDLKPGETPEACLRRMEAERKF